MIGSSLAGMPSPQKELTDEFNVLEAGLWNSISLNKGTHFLPLSLSLFYFILFILLLFLTYDWSNTQILISIGCYKGQETISRLITYDGVKQRLWGLQLSDSVEPGSPITIDGKRVPISFYFRFNFFYGNWNILSNTPLITNLPLFCEETDYIGFECSPELLSGVLKSDELSLKNFSSPRTSNFQTH